MQYDETAPDSSPLGIIVERFSKVSANKRIWNISLLVCVIRHQKR
jgi:hypothetical protein